jgi:hypothetical protein
MDLFVSIFQWLARYLFGAHFAEKGMPSFRAPAEAFPLWTWSGEDRWSGVGWMKVRLVMEEFGGLPRRCAVPLRVSYSLRAVPRANCLELERFLSETSHSSHLRTCFPPPDFPGW